VGKRGLHAGLRDEGATVITAQRSKDEEFDSITADFFDPHTPEQIVSEVIARTGRLDVLINNAGMMQEASIEEMSLEDWQRNLTLI
jgi:meso-butanediol dehydrogenase/(S,S)-butanediol dehydrogenase/diacetyl reductase